MVLSWKEILGRALKKILIGTIAVLGVKAVENVVEGKDILGRKVNDNPEKNPKIILNESDYKVI